MPGRSRGGAQRDHTPGAQGGQGGRWQERAALGPHDLGGRGWCKWPTARGVPGGGHRGPGRPCREGSARLCAGQGGGPGDHRGGLGRRCGASGGSRGYGARRPRQIRSPPQPRPRRACVGLGLGWGRGRAGARAAAGAWLGPAARRVRRCGSPVRRRGRTRPEARTVGHPLGRPGGRKRWSQAAAGRGRRVHPVPGRFVPRHGTGPASSASRRLGVLASREREGAQAARPSGPVPAGGPGVPPAWSQTWGGPRWASPAGGKAAWHVPRKRRARARPGTRQAGARGARPVAPSGDSAPPGTREGTGGCEARASMPRGPPREWGAKARACQAAAAVCKSRWSRQGCDARGTGRRSAGSGTVPRQDGTGRRRAHCGSRQRVAVALCHVGPCRG